MRIFGFACQILFKERVAGPGRSGSQCQRTRALLDDLGHDAGADGAAAFADGKAQPFFHGDRGDQLDSHLDVVARHHHLLVLGQLDRAGHVGGAEVELRPVVVEERRVTAALFLAQHVDLGREVGVRLDGAGLAQHLAALDFLALGAAQQDADVVAGLALVQQLAEHLHAGAGGLLRRPDADDLDFVADLDDAALDAAGHHGAAPGDARTRLRPASGRRRRWPARASGCSCPARRPAS